MTEKPRAEIIIKGAKTNNLKDVSLRIPHHQFIVVTGISGSGKSSLVFDIISKEGQRRYFETLPSFARQFLGKLNRPEVDAIEGLSPVIAIGQSAGGKHARSTVGTMSDIYDLLRLLYARTGKTDRDIRLSRSLFSFNSSLGKCVQCNGIGKEEKIDLERLVIHPEKTIREGALAPTLPNGYIMYSQVTIDVLNQVCEAEGFSVDIPWQDLSEDQKRVILYGSNKIEVPFGKHSLASRLKWTGIKAKPREEGHYKGMIPIMSDILRRDRNANILKYVHAVTCQSCQGHRLNQAALSVLVQRKSIADIVTWELNELLTWITESSWRKTGQRITNKILDHVHTLVDLGLGHLTLDRTAKTLRSSEVQRIRVANQLLVPLSDVLYVFDEPSIGLHSEEKDRMIYHFKELVKKGNTVIVVEHDLDTIRQADHIIEIGPKAGSQGGELIFNGSFSDFLAKDDLSGKSATYHALNTEFIDVTSSGVMKAKAIHLQGCRERNLKNIDVNFKLGQLNVVSGKSGSGKSSLVKGTLLNLVKKVLGEESNQPSNLAAYENVDAINKLIFIDHSPIGKTPRSNPATYLGLSDHIRDVFAGLPEAKSKGFTKSRFSFNNKGGRCEACQGAGKTQIGMHFLGQVDLVCGTCNGDRFNKETLEVKYQALSIADVYRLSVKEAIGFFQSDKKVLSGLNILQEIGLGYLTLGQSSTTLSGGEAQRIKIANQLQKKDAGETLYIIIEPSIGLHHQDIGALMQLFNRIKKSGNTIVCIEQNEYIIANCDWHIELGPESGRAGGKIAYQGIPRKQPVLSVKVSDKQTNQVTKEIKLEGVTTHGLKNIDVCLPKNQLTVVTGLSGSGKSSLVYDTLFAESNARFSESLSTHNRSFLQQNSEAKIVKFSGLGPAIGINRKGGAPSSRSTVGTLSGVYASYRLLYSRLAQHNGENFTAQHFSFNHHLGACPTCLGMGIERQCDPDQIIVDPKKSILDGAISTNKAVAYYADPQGQFMATLTEVAKQNNWPLNKPWQELNLEIQQAILYGTGEKIWDVIWSYKTKARTGTEELKVKWLGFCEYINEEFERKRLNKNIKSLEETLHEVSCSLCEGSRLKIELLCPKFAGKNIHELSQMSIAASVRFLNDTITIKDEVQRGICKVVLPGVLKSLKTLDDLGLGHLNLDRAITSLSGGERQRVNLAGQLSNHLFGVIYVLDEPTIGLDEGQIEVLLAVLKNIVANGNTVVAVEHDANFIQAADCVIELGPGAGKQGGEVVYQGRVEDIKQIKESITCQMLMHRRQPKIKQPSIAGESFGIKGARANNLKGIDVSFNAQQVIGIKGVSGSGKSSLIKEVLFTSWSKKRAINCDEIYGLDQFEEVLLIDQEGLEQKRNSTPATYTDIMDQLKTLFAKTDEAKENGWKRADFSYQSKKGKCNTCQGYGKVKTSMDFMSDLWLACDSCQGQRYHQDMLTCKYKDHSIGQVLDMTVNEAIAFFDKETIAKSLQILEKVGIGHLILGQAGNTLSGGEAQRLKLGTALMKKKKGPTLYLFDEPSTGLHYFDILSLIEVFESMITQGDTVIFIEHDKTLLGAANQVLILGPGCGEEGGNLI